MLLLLKHMAKYMTFTTSLYTCMNSQFMDIFVIKHETFVSRTPAYTVGLSVMTSDITGDMSLLLFNACISDFQSSDFLSSSCHCLYVLLGKQMKCVFSDVLSKHCTILANMFIKNILS